MSNLCVLIGNTEIINIYIIQFSVSLSAAWRREASLVFFLSVIIILRHTKNLFVVAVSRSGSSFRRRTVQYIRIDNEPKITMKRLLNTLIIPVSVAAFAVQQQPPSSSSSSSSSHHPTMILYDRDGGGDFDMGDSTNMPPPSIDSDDLPPPRKRKEIVMSPAIPFLECPPVLVDCTMAGNVGFDPLGYAKTPEDLIVMRESEIRHARLAMLVC